jgi:voltage-gated sodium channel
MMIGIVVEVLDEEHKKLTADQDDLDKQEHVDYEVRIERELQALHQKLDALLAQQAVK